MPITRQALLLLGLFCLYACNLTVEKEGHGTVRSVSGLIDCGDQCQVQSNALKQNAPPYTEVLMAIPDEGYLFAGWEGACSGIQECSVRVTNWSGNKKVIARFVRQPLPRQVAIGSAHACWQGDLGVECWGDNQAGQLEIPAEITSAEALYAGTLNSCAQTTSGLVCWGDGDIAPVPESARFPDKVAVGWYHACAIVEAAVQCWGNNDYGQSIPPAGLLNPSDLTAGAYHTCATTDAGVVCWGAGTVDDGVFPQTGQSIVPAALVNSTAIGAGNAHTCALQDGGVICWGENLWGQLEVPTLDGEITNFAVGGSHSCVVVDDTVHCWGSNQSNQLDIADGLTDIRDIQAGNRNVCVFAADKLVCWGYNRTGLNNVPRSLARPVKIEAGETQFCALGEDGVHCWGTGAGVPNTLQDVTDMGIGNRHQCYIDRTGLACFGDNNQQQLQVPDVIAQNAQAVEAGYDHNCAIDGEGQVVCWGDGFSGQTTVPELLDPVSTLALGNDISCALQPTAAVCWGYLASQPLSHPTVMDAANNHACAIDDNGVQCWGYDTYNKLNPPPLTHPRDVSVGSEHSCALADEGVVCWGAGVAGSSGGMNRYQQSVVPVDRLQNPRDVEAALSYSCALDDIGILCWGFRNLRIITR